MIFFMIWFRCFIFWLKLDLFLLNVNVILYLMMGDFNSIKIIIKSNINMLDIMLEKLSKIWLISCIIIFGLKFFNVEIFGIVRGIFYLVMNVLSVFNWICKIFLYCGMDVVNLWIVLLIIFVKKRKSIIIKISIKVIVSFNGIFCLVIKWIVGE